jgi:hypothetical protein
MVSVWRADTKDTLPADTINVFYSSASNLTMNIAAAPSGGKHLASTMIEYV